MYSGNGIWIGHDVAIAANCTIAPVNHDYSNSDKKISAQGFLQSKGGVKIGNDVWVGAGCVFLDGCEVGDGCVIGAGSLVKGILDPFTVYAGNPIKMLKRRQ